MEILEKNGCGHFLDKGNPILAVTPSPQHTNVWLSLVIN